MSQAGHRRNPECGQELRTDMVACTRDLKQCCQPRSGTYLDAWRTGGRVVGGDGRCVPSAALGRGESATADTDQAERLGASGVS